DGGAAGGPGPLVAGRPGAAGRRAEDVARLVVGLEERLDEGAPRRGAPAGAVREPRPVGARGGGRGPPPKPPSARVRACSWAPLLPRRGGESRSGRRAFYHHAPSGRRARHGKSPDHDGSRGASWRKSQARANDQSRSAVRRTTPSAAAASSSVRPA